MFRNIMASQIGGGGSEVSSELTIHLIKNNIIIGELTGSLDDIPYTWDTYTDNEECELAIEAQCDRFKNLDSMRFYCAEADLKSYDPEKGIVRVTKYVDVYVYISMILQFVRDDGKLVNIVTVPIST